jgi:hypothetical protein
MQVKRLGATRALIAVGATAGLALALFAPAAGAGGQGGAAPLTVVKTVSGPVPAGTTFTATIQCSDDIIETDGGGTDQATVTFDDKGQPTSADTVTFNDPGECAVTETVNGGASSTTYDCEGSAPVDEPEKESEFSASQVEEPEVVCAIVNADGVEVNIFNESQEALVTIHNTFAEPTPQPAAQVVAQPAFTG